MKISMDQLIERLADNAVQSADMDELMSYFRDGQIKFLEDMTEIELKEYASEELGYNVDEEL